MTTKYVQSKRAVLQGSINDSTTTCTLTGFLDLSGNPILQADIGETGEGTFEPNTDREEAVSFTIDSNVDGVAVLTLTRGLLGKAPYGTGGTAFAHDSGTEFVMSNNPSLFNKMTAKDNNEVVTGSWEFPAPTADSSPATKQYVDENVAGGPVSQDRVVVAATAGAAIALGDLVYFDETDSEWKKTAGATAATLNNVKLGIAQGGGVDGGSIAGGVLTYGLDSTQTGMTVGIKLYAGDTAGSIAESAGTIEKVIGVSISDTQLYFDTNFNNILTSSQKAAMGGVNNAPTELNKLVTEDDLSDDTIKPPQVVTFTASGTWTKDANLKYLIVELVGGGGGGGDDPGDNADGGAAGGYSRKIILASELGATETVTIGAGGLHESAQAGSATSFGSHLQATGGAYANNESGGGVGSGGDINFKGEAGNRGSDSTSSQGSEYGKGGPSFFGKGTNSGAGGDQNTDGEAGIVIVTEHYV